MINKLSNEQQTMVFGGSSYCVFDDGKVLVCYTGETSQWVLYDNWDDASAEAKGLGNGGIGTFTPRRPKDRLFAKMRQDIELDECVA
ncbi:MAG: hypothetical protein RUMPE_00208 [Eubacteriales bacterium SKADARSKE-1]|nr:hypothetical protein [Eubacteriales bacterium SKADARSKE-1]